MSVFVNAELISKKELFVGFRYAEFQYRHYNDGKKSSEISFLNLVTRDYDFKLIWTINCTYAYQGNDSLLNWANIELIQLTGSEKKFFGNYEIKHSNFTGNCECRQGEFDSDALPLNRSSKMTNYCRSGYSYTIKIQVYWVDDRLSIIENYDKLFENQESADIKFIIDDEEIPAFKNILSVHSDVFFKMFETEMLEKETNRVEVLDIEPKIFKLLLRFIYCGKLDCNDTDELLKLSVAADKYEVRSLVSLCGYRISNNLSVDNAVDALHVADKVRNDCLKEDCMDFIIKNKDQVIDTESFKSVLVESRADLLADIFRRLKCV